MLQMHMQVNYQFDIFIIIVPKMGIVPRVYTVVEVFYFRGKNVCHGLGFKL